MDKDDRKTAKSERRERQERIARAKSDLSVSVIQYNHAIDRMMGKMEEALRECRALAAKFASQRELSARSKMTDRVINSSLKMVASNRLQLWMIDDRGLEEGIE